MTSGNTPEPPAYITPL